MNAIRGLAFLLLLQVAGEAITHALSLPFPGPVVGMILLLAALRFRWVHEPIAAAADALLSHLSLLFVPVGVGVVTHLDLVSKYGIQLMLVIVVSTWIGMVTTSALLRWLLRNSAEGEATRG